MTIIVEFKYREEVRLYTLQKNLPYHTLVKELNASFQTLINNNQITKGLVNSNNNNNSNESELKAGEDGFDVIFSPKKAGEKFRLTYVDEDNDLVTIDSDLGLQEATRVADSGGLTRIFIEIKDPQYALFFQIQNFVLPSFLVPILPTSNSSTSSTLPTSNSLTSTTSTKTSITQIEDTTRTPNTTSTSIPNTSTSSPTPTPSTPTPSTPTPSTPTPSIPTPSIPTPSIPAPSTPTPSLSSPPSTPSPTLTSIPSLTLTSTPTPTPTPDALTSVPSIMPISSDSNLTTTKAVIPPSSSTVTSTLTTSDSPNSTSPIVSSSTNPIGDISIPVVPVTNSVTKDSTDYSNSQTSSISSTRTGEKKYINSNPSNQEKNSSIHVQKEIESPKSDILPSKNSRSLSSSSVSSLSSLNFSSLSSSSPSTFSLSSPFEAVCMKHIRRSLHYFEDYYLSMFKDFCAKETKMKLEFSMQTECGNVDIDALRKKQGKLLDDIRRRFQKNVATLIEKYDDYMSNISPCAFLLPIMITLSIGNRPLSFDISVRMTDVVCDMRDMLVDLTNATGNGIVEFGPLSCFAFRHSHHRKKETGKEERNKLVGFFLGRKSQGEYIRPELIENEELTVGQLQLTNGAELILLGGVRLANEDVRCGTGLGDKSMQFFSCLECSETFVCKPCAMHCHKGHSLQLVINETDECHCGEVKQNDGNIKVIPCKIRPIKVEETKNKNSNSNANSNTYEDQLRQLKSMGFDDNQLSLHYLKFTGGNIDQTVQHILEYLASKSNPVVQPLQI